MVRILVVEDEARVAAFIQRGLAEEGFDVDVAEDAASALVAARRGEHDVVVLDIGLPDRDGFTVMEMLRREGNTVPLLMLTARDAPEDVVRGLNGGADDYLTKPFDFGELVARIRALGRRFVGGTAPVRAADIELDPVRRRVTRGGEPVRLTPTEFRLLEVLMRAGGEPVRRRDLLDRVWGMSFDPGTTLIDVHIANLRSKLEERGRPRAIATVKGVGFRMVTHVP